MSVTETPIEGHMGPWTVEDVLALPAHPARARYELVDGVLFMSPAPGLAHQIVSYALRSQIDAASARSGARFLTAGAVMVASDSRLFIPDIAVVDRAAVSRSTLAAPLEAMLLLGEIVSPFSRAADRILKPALYAQAKVPAYWRVEMEPDLCVVVHALDGDTYREVATVTGKASVDVAGEFTVDLDLDAVRRELEG
ncbi:Uma2 family endonuclease [Streptomyces sp. 4503]|uniref:Uma2 family endonuclease n=1 Tax=Streptomyces niphimycinicus TaxID=2842201 RepID=A0ABS6CBM0_9ACTN|nr:Uma2 family endonuclease [Streptomyces niphimycinicus]MBU3864297.1 Uma2 family endonuclease [Streptomyces niphimycinicus]